ncbi:VOC family protein [Demequina iriomotensis]|uniref:VOC family protein n=1 Tax=Demequina iriomotensis TaxID=1536641 RepID=UPI000780E358|nr:VOC family protein [Demequina iriomotensis]
MPERARLDHVGLTVADLVAASSWYRDAFGLDVDFTGRVDAIGLDFVMLIDGDGRRLELLHREGSTRGPRAADPAEAALREGFGHMAFDVRGLDEVFARLVGMGAREVMTPRPSPEPGIRMAFVADPEGNLIELLERRADGLSASDGR